MSKIEIYTNKNCGYCKQIKEEFDKNKVKFKEKSVENFQDEYQQIVNLTGLPTVPTIKFEGEYFVPGRDYGTPQQLINILQNFKLTQRLVG